MASKWREYQADAARRVEEKMAERRAMEEKLANLPPRDPCRTCNVRPEFHDEHGCSRYR